MTEVQQGQAIALGITIDTDNDVVVIVVIQDREGQNIAVSMMPDMAIHFGRSIRDLSREAQKLQDELDDLDPEEIADRLHAIQNRYGSTDLQPPV